MSRRWILRRPKKYPTYPQRRKNCPHENFLWMSRIKNGYYARAAVSELATALQDSDPEVQGLAVWVLDILGPESRKLFPILQRLSQNDPNESIRENVDKTMVKLPHWLFFLGITGYFLGEEFC